MFQGSFAFEYFPLRVSSALGKLEFNSTELGLFPYELSLKAIQADPEKPIYFQTYLGGNQTATAKFFNYSKTKGDVYMTKVKAPSSF